MPDWARETLNQHKRDIRTHLYSIEELELAMTDDKLWNAAQLKYKGLPFRQVPRFLNQVQDHYQKVQKDLKS